MFQVLFGFSVSNGSFGFEALVENIYRKRQTGAKSPCGARQQIGEYKLFSIVLCLLFFVPLNMNEAKHQLVLPWQQKFCSLQRTENNESDLYFLNLNFLLWHEHSHAQLCADVNIISPHTLLPTPSCPHGEGFAKRHLPEQVSWDSALKVFQVIWLWCLPKAPPNGFFTSSWFGSSSSSLASQTPARCEPHEGQAESRRRKGDGIHAAVVPSRTRRTVCSNQCADEGRENAWMSGCVWVCVIVAGWKSKFLDFWSLLIAQEGWVMAWE